MKHLRKKFDSVIESIDANEASAWKFFAIAISAWCMLYMLGGIAIALLG